MTLNPTPSADQVAAALGAIAALESAEGAPDDSRTIASAIARRAARGGDYPALLATGLPHVTFSDLASCIAGFADQLGDAGLRAGHRVGLIVPPGLPGGQLAVALASNVTLVPINPALTPDEVIEFAVCSGLHAIVVPRWVESGSRAALRYKKITVLDAVMAPDGTLRLELLTDPVHAAIPRRAVVSSDVALLLRSSATTGAPKMIPVTHGNLAAMADTLGSDLWFKLGAEDRAACTLPLHYAAGLKTSLFVPLMLGAGVAFPPPKQVFELAEWIDALQPTYLSVAPGTLHRMLEPMRAASRAFDARSLRFVMCGASYLPDETRVAAQSMLRVPVLEFYGLSEAGVVAANPVPPGKAKPGTVGVPAPGQLLIVDEDRNPVAEGTVGQIMICGPTLMPGYLGTGNSDSNELKDGWLLTGDLGWLDRDGYLCIEGRVKEVINRGGEKVFPYEVEKAILQHPAVLEAAAFGVPHPRLGESVAAAVVLKPGNTVTERELMEFLSARLAAFKLPRRLCYPPSLPRGSSGKVLRKSLSETHATPVREFVTDSFLHLELLDLWQRLLGTPDIGLDDDFFDKGGDSLLAVKLLLEVEAIAGKPYPQSELSTLTIRRIAEVLRSDMPAQRDLMTQVKSGSGIPLFFCHGDYIERGIYAQKLAALLPDDQPVFLLHCYADQFLGSSIEEIAQVYLRQVLSAAPGSPVFVAGYCNGGTVAWHLAHLLRSAGVEVVELLLIETPSLNARPALRELPGILDAAGALIPGRTGRALREHGMRYVWYLVRGLGAGGFQVRRKVHVERRKPLLGDANAMATRTYFAYMSRYVPPAIDVGVTCFIADQGRHFDTDPTYWRHLAPSVGKVSAPGTHQGMCVSGRQVLAIELAEVLDRATRHFLLRSDRPGICVREVALG